MTSVSFITFCCAKDGHLLHAPGQLKKQIESNQYVFDEVIVVHQKCNPNDFGHFSDCNFNIKMPIINSDYHIDSILQSFGYNLSKSQYQSPDNNHQWKYHNVNHLHGIGFSNSEYTLFADNDCWMVPSSNWIPHAINILKNNPNIFIVSPNDGENERMTYRMSQQMFLCRTEEFRNADFNQPGFDGNVNVQGGPFPEYWALLEGRVELHCRNVNKYRYVCPPKYRYWHHNRLNEQGHYEINYSKY